jgi:HK97 family phage major capsid protein
VNDWPAFQSYAGTELYRQIIDEENRLLLLGDLSSAYDGFTGFFATDGILTHDASGDTGTAVTALDSVEKAIAQLRTGPALAVPDLLVLHPETWSALRRIKDLYGHFLVEPDPTQAQADQLWGVDVLQTTEIPAGSGLLIDLDKFGYVAVREPLPMRLVLLPARRTPFVLDEVIQGARSGDCLLHGAAAE